MENKVLEKNLKQISKYDKELCNKILMSDFEKSNIKITKTQKDEYNLIYNNFLIHNDTGATDEAKKIVEKIENKENKNTLRIVYGLGLGYLADEISSVNSKIIIYEPNIDILSFVLNIAEIDAIYKENVIICADEKTLKKYVTNFSNPDTKISLSFLPSYKTLFYEDILNIIKVVQKAQGQHLAAQNTLIKNAPKAIFNSFRNLKNIVKNPNIQDLKNLYKNKNATALCLSAGPSLRENIETIKANQDKFVIFAVNPTIKLLKEFDIKPDFIVDIEIGDTIRQFDTINTEDYYFILEGFCSFIISQMKTKKTFNYISDSNFINPWIRDCLKINDELKTLGTVSYTALMSAYIMGFERIILCGQDLAYKDGQCYAKGSQFEDLECIFDETEQKYKIIAPDFEKYTSSFKTERNTQETAKEIAKNNLEFLNKNIYTVKSQEGKNIPTQTGYALFIDWFVKASEELKTKNPNIKLINSSTGGAQIDGFENIELKNIISELKTVEKPNLSEYQAKIDKPFVINKIQIMKEKLKIFNGAIKELIEITQKIIKEIEIKKVLTQNADKLIQKQEDLIFQIISTKKDNDLKLVTLVFLHNFAEIIKTNYKDDIVKTNEALKKILEQALSTKKYIDLYIKDLTNCQTLILK